MHVRFSLGIGRKEDIIYYNICVYDSKIRSTRIEENATYFSGVAFPASHRSPDNITIICHIYVIHTLAANASVLL